MSLGSLSLAPVALSWFPKPWRASGGRQWSVHTPRSGRCIWEADYTTSRDGDVCSFHLDIREGCVCIVSPHLSARRALCVTKWTDLTFAFKDSPGTLRLALAGQACCCWEAVVSLPVFGASGTESHGGCKPEPGREGKRCCSVLDLDTTMEIKSGSCIISLCVPLVIVTRQLQWDPASVEAVPTETPRDF